MGTSGSQLDPIEVAVELRQQGLRATSARLALVECLNELGHATVDQLHEAVAGRLPSLSASTVYRALESLAEHGLVRHAHLGGSVPSYYLTNGPEHAHLVCSGCGSVQNLAGPILQQFVTDVSRAAQFAVDTSHLTVQGRCAACQPPAAQ